MFTNIFMGKRKEADGITRDYGDDPEDFEIKNKYNYQGQDWSYEGCKYGCQDCREINDISPA